MNKLYLKNEIFDLFENARILFNDYYNGKENYAKEDLKEIINLMLITKCNIANIESEIMEEIN